MARTVLIFAMFTMIPLCFASRSNTGTEFILGFMDNDTPTKVGLEIFVTTMSNTPADVSVTTPLYDSSWSATATIGRQEVELLILPWQLRVKGTGKDNKGVRVKSTQPITVYCVNKEQYTTDAYMGIPVHVVGKEYYAIGYIANAQILFIGVTDNTNIQVKLSDNSRSGSAKSVSSVDISYNGQRYRNGQTMSFSINRYETFFVTQWVDYNSDLTGSYATSDKPVSCISGNYRCWIPKGTSSSDHLTEMLPSVDAWGKEFITTSTPDRSIGDLFRVVASEDGTNVNFGNGRYTCSLSKAGDFCELDIATNDYMTVVADKPVQIGMFAKTWQNDGPHYGDPAMSLLIPTVQYASEYTWSTTNLPNGQPFNDKVSVIIKKSHKTGLLLDGSAISGTWYDVVGSSEWTQTWTRIQPGSHNLYHVDPTVTFMALASGTENYNSYAFSAGTRMAQINAPCSPTSPVAGDTVDNDCDGAVDEEALDGIDNDGDGQIDEDLALPPRVDGNWGDWVAWSSCSVSCGGVGTITRTRACDNPAPQNNGLDCPGSGSESQSCDMRGTPCPVNGGWTSFTAWGTCSVTCGIGTQTRTRSCTNPAPAHGGADCAGVTSETKSCDTGVSCAVHGGWGTWGPWSACSVSCGGVGILERTRVCDRPAPRHGGDDCVGSELDTTPCDNTGLLCPSGNVWEVLTFTTTPGAPVDGGFSTWSDWTECTVTCGGGVSLRQRFCNNPTPQWGGAMCSPDIYVETEGCNTQACTPNGYAHGVAHGGVCTGQRGQFDCKNGIQCVDLTLKCDCVPHCQDGSDEDIEYAGCLISLAECKNSADRKAKMTLILPIILALGTLIVNALKTL